MKSSGALALDDEKKSAALAFFDALFDDARALISRFPLTIEPPTMNYISGVLEPAAEAARASRPFGNPDKALARERAQAAAGAGHAVGLNTVGMLLDRLSILAIKTWNLEQRAKAPEKARALRETQIAELVEALADSRPGHSSINNKLTSHRTDVDAADFAEACTNLVTTNLLLWEAQEILYNHNISALPDDELRKYIQFFSRHNLKRNVSIEASDRLYWAGVRASLS
ncbi:MAG TPA: hypothetical protein VH019_01380 [Rhizomicrobium sp.]|jgi:hypothetical protein|nr:hypothetical protein [Rhizomicrobium sp.]